MKHKVWLFFILFLSLGLALYSCGGGGGGSSSSSSSSTTKNAQATLGPLGGATVKVYHLLNNGTKVLIHTTTTSKGTTLDKIGYFNSYQNELNPNDWYVYEVNGGMDYDANDDGIKDDNATPNYGTLCLVARGDEVQGLGEIKVTLASNMVCNAVNSQFGNPDNLTNAIQEAVNSIFDNSTHKPTMEDLLTFNPVKDRSKLRKKYQKGWFNLVNEIKNGAPIPSPILYKKQLTEDEGDGGTDIDNNTFYLYYTYDNDSTGDVMLNIEKMSSDNYSFDNTTIDLTTQLTNDNLNDPYVSDGFIYDGNIYLAVKADDSSTGEYCSGVYEINLDNKTMKLMKQYCDDEDIGDQYSIISMTQANGNLYYLLDTTDDTGNDSYTLYKKPLSDTSLKWWTVNFTVSYINSFDAVKVSNNNTVYFLYDDYFKYASADSNNEGGVLQPSSVVDDNNTPIESVNNISMCDSNTKLLASTDNGLYLIDADNKSVIKKFADKHSVKAAACDSSSYYYIGANFNTLRGRSNEDYSYSLHIIDKKTYQDKKTAIKFSPDTEIENMLAKDGVIYITTDSSLIIIDSYMASRVKLPNSSSVQSKVVNDVNGLFLLAKSPDNSLLYVLYGNDNDTFTIKSLKIPSLDNGSLSIGLPSEGFQTSITKDGSLMFVATSDGSLYKIDLKTQSYRKFTLQLPNTLGLRESSLSSFRYLSFSPTTNKLYLSNGYDVDSVKIEPTDFDNGSSTTTLDNITELNISENIQGKYSILDISASQDGKALSVLTQSKVYLFGLNDNDNVTLISSPSTLVFSSYGNIAERGMFLRMPDSTAQSDNIKRFAFVYSEYGYKGDGKPPMHACLTSFNISDNTSTMDCTSFTPYIYFPPTEDNIPVFADLSGFAATPSNYGMNMGYFNLFAIPATQDSLQNIFSNDSINQFTLYASEDCYYQGKAYFIFPVLLIGDTLYGTYCPDPNDDNYCKIFYTKAVNTQ